jgi:hypothetical protein
MQEKEIRESDGDGDGDKALHIWLPLMMLA